MRDIHVISAILDFRSKMLLFVFQILKDKIEIIDLGLCFRGSLLYSSVFKIHFSVESTQHDLEVCEFLLVCLQLKLFIVGEVCSGAKGEDSSGDKFDLVYRVTDMQYGRVC